MGRPHITQPPVPVDFIQQAFAVRQDGTLVRRECHVAALAHEPAAFALNGRLMVRVYVNGKIRRIAASRTAWALATGNWPKGVVRHRNGDDRDCRQENLLLTRHGRDPFGAISNKHSKGGRASSLAERWARTTTLIRTLADHPGATVPQISRLVGSSASCTCTRLGKLSDMGLTCGPKCDARARWDLTPAGKALAASAIPPLDNLDRDILMIIVRSPAKLMALAHRIEVCRLTMRRRIDRLVEQKLMFPHEGRYAITDAGIAALGPDAPQRQPWVNLERVRASTARDVVARHGQEPDDRTRAFRSKVASLGAQQGLATTRLRRNSAFNPAWGRGVLTG